MSQKSLLLSTSCTQNCPETEKLKLEKMMHLKRMLFLKVSQHTLIFATQLFSKVSRLLPFVGSKCYNMHTTIDIFN